MNTGKKERKKSNDYYSSPIRSRSRSKTPLRSAYSTVTPIYGRNSLDVPPTRICEYHVSPAARRSSLSIERDYSPVSKQTPNVSLKIMNNPEKFAQ